MFSYVNYIRYEMLRFSNKAKGSQVPESQFLHYWFPIS